MTYDEDDDGKALQAQAEAKLNAAFGAHMGLNADWINKAWYVAGEGEENRNPDRMDIPAGRYTHHGIWIVDDEGRYCVYERTLGEDEQYEDDELFCAPPTSIEIVIGQARFHASRLVKGYSMPSRGGREENPAKPLVITTAIGAFEAPTISAATERAKTFVRQHRTYAVVSRNGRSMLGVWWDGREVQTTSDAQAIEQIALHGAPLRHTTLHAAAKTGSLWTSPPASGPQNIEILERFARYPHFHEMLHEYAGLEVPAVVPVRWVPISSILTAIPTHSAEEAAVERAFIADVAKRMKAGEDIPPTFLYGGAIHDGRHRTVAAHTLGLQLAPVVDLDPYWDQAKLHAGLWSEAEAAPRSAAGATRRPNPYEIEPGVILTDAQMKALYEIRERPRSVWDYGSTTIHRLRKLGLIETRPGAMGSGKMAYPVVRT